MKILYVTNYENSVKSSGYVNDYLNDLTFFGFYELWKDGVIDEIVDSTPIVSLYKEYESKIQKQYLWGGMTALWLIDKNDINRDNIEEKIKAKYFDLIIYGNCRRCLDYYDIVTSIYPPDKVFFFDGNDDSDILPHNDKHVYFKRELLEKSRNVLPISFSMPTCKFTTNLNRDKTQDYGTVIPGDKSTYIFNTEESYYNDYRDSYYGATMKKAGWDCMRHYEILGNGCIPYFIDLDKCPNDALLLFPKELVKQGMLLTTIDKFDTVTYNSILDELFEYTKNHLSTKSMAKYILETTQ